MKKIILCEGENDVVFLENVLKKLVDEKYIDVFRQSQNKEKRSQSRKIASFLNPFNSREILAKEENGWQKMIKVFCSENSRFLCECNTMLLLDADYESFDRSIKGYTNEIKRKMNSNASNIKCKTFCEDLRTFNFEGRESIKTFKINLLFNSRKTTFQRNFLITLFKPDFEEFAGIRTTDRRNEINEKIQAVVDNEKIISFFKHVCNKMSL